MNYPADSKECVDETGAKVTVLGKVSAGPHTHIPIADALPASLVEGILRKEKAISGMNS